MAIKLVDAARQGGPVESELPFGETTLYFPNGPETKVVVLEGDQVSLDTNHAHPDVVIYGVGTKPETVEALKRRGVRSVTLRPDEGSPVLKYTYGPESLYAQVERR